MWARIGLIAGMVAAVIIYYAFIVPSRPPSEGYTDAVASIALILLSIILATLGALLGSFAQRRLRGRSVKE